MSYNVDEKVVKRPQDDSPLTEWQQDEWIKCAIDKYYFFENYCYIQTDKGRMLFNVRDYQREIIDASEENRFTINLLGRQSGKTTTFGLDVLHDITFSADYSVGITSYSNRNVFDYVDRIKYTYEHLPWWLKPPVILYNRTTIRFNNNSLVFAQVTSENTFRGMTPRRIISDELAFVNPLVSEEFMGSLLPSLSAGGSESTTRLNIISTPRGTEGVFPSLWFGAIDGTNGFAPVEIEYERIPGRDEEFEKEMVSKIGREKFDQEFRNVFISSSGTLVNSRMLESIRYKEPVDTFSDLEIFVDSFQGRKLAIACDIGEGVGEDNSVIQIVDLDTFEQVAEYANNTISQTLFCRFFVKMINMLFERGAADIYFTYENNGVGAGVARLLESVQDENFLHATLITQADSPIGRTGMQTNRKTKAEGCAQLKDMIEMHTLQLKSRKLISELKFFVKKKTSFEALPGAKDDRVMAMVVLMNMLKEIGNYEDSVYDAVHELDMDNDDGEWADIYL